MPARLVDQKSDGLGCPTGTPEPRSALHGANLTPPQRDVVEAGLLSVGFPVVLHMPTGSGKTWLAEQAIGETLAAGRRALYLAPLRALASELLERWTLRFPDHRVGAFTGEYGIPGRPYPVPMDEAQLLVMTPERLDACTRAWRSHWDWITETDIVVVDELHLLGDPHRGPRLEGAIGRFRRLNPFARIIGLSATLGNAGELADWLGGVDYRSDWRPIPLTWRTVRFRKAADKPRLLLQEVGRCLAGGGKSLVFVQSRRRAQQVAEQLTEAGIPAEFHHAGLDTNARRNREARFRSGETSVLVATGTLELGLNIGVAQVCLYDLQAWDGVGYAPLTVQTVWQRAGRAGRPGFDKTGEAVLFAPSWDRALPPYEAGRFEPVFSSLGSPATLAEQVLAEVASGMCRTIGHLERALGGSLAAWQRRLPPVVPAVADMLEAGMLTEDSAEDGSPRRLRATKLGRIAARQMLSPQTVLQLSAALSAPDREDLTLFDLLLLACATPDAEATPPVDFEELGSLTIALGTERSCLLTAGHAMAVARLPVAGRRLLMAIKAALLARAWTRLGDQSAVAENLCCYPSEIGRITANLERVLTAAVAILAPVPPNGDDLAPDPFAPPEDEASLYERVKALRNMVLYGVGEDAVSLTMLPGIGGTLARRLFELGIVDVEEFATATAEEVAAARGISLSRATSLIGEAEQVVKTRSAFTFRDRGPRVSPAPADWPPTIDPYRLRRALDLEVRQAGSGIWEIRGGSEPRRIQTDAAGERSCDCPDHAKGAVCKHLLAVGIAQGEPDLLPLVARLRDLGAGAGGIDLFALWNAHALAHPLHSAQHA